VWWRSYRAKKTLAEHLGSASKKNLVIEGSESELLQQGPLASSTTII
jgi:hypothetical protein